MEVAEQTAALPCHLSQPPQPPQVTDGIRLLEVHNGVKMLTLVTAAGCSLTALVAAFVSQVRP